MSRYVVAADATELSWVGPAGWVGLSRVTEMDPRTNFSVMALASAGRYVSAAKIKKADITFAAHCHNVNVLLSNISLFD